MLNGSSRRLYTVPRSPAYHPERLVQLDESLVITRVSAGMQVVKWNVQSFAICEMFCAHSAEVIMEARFVGMTSVIFPGSTSLLATKADTATSWGVQQASLAFEAGSAGESHVTHGTFPKPLITKSANYLEAEDSE
jgi:hypothetical protein